MFRVPVNGDTFGRAIPNINVNADGRATRCKNLPATIPQPPPLHAAALVAITAIWRVWSVRLTVNESEVRPFTFT